MRSLHDRVSAYYPNSDRVKTAASKTYSYDAKGNVSHVSVGGTTSASAVWSVDNRLTSLTNSGGTSLYTTYNGSGLRTGKTVNGGATKSHPTYSPSCLRSSFRQKRDLCAGRLGAAEPTANSTKIYPFFPHLQFYQSRKIIGLLLCHKSAKYEGFGLLIREPVLKQKEEIEDEESRGKEEKEYDVSPFGTIVSLTHDFGARRKGGGKEDEN
ncbi:MAG: hypothetical protein H7308_08045 [Chthonomonadaceae bacterium]|nr:hypothetical protein [Chthonomonadaceae bacterium]